MKFLLNLKLGILKFTFAWAMCFQGAVGIVTLGFYLPNFSLPVAKAIAQARFNIRQL